MKKALSIYLVLFAVSVAVNFLWEISHVRLYQWLGPMPLTTAHLFWFSVKDAFLYLSFILIVALLAKDLFWFIKGRKIWHWVLALTIGFVVSTLIERHAIATGRWAYLSTMPIIPGLEVGLSPVLQMTVGLIITLLILKQTVSTLRDH